MFEKPELYKQYMKNLLIQIAKERFAKLKSQLVHFVDDKRCYKTALTAGFRVRSHIKRRIQ